MKDYFFRYAPVIIPVGDAGIWVVAFLFYNEKAFNVILFSCNACQLLLFLLCGIMIKKLHSQSNHDSLTGLFNRRYFYKKMSEFSTTKLPISLMMMDVDNFKRINDTHGHSAGDEALKQLTEIFESNTRRTDVVARLGGEEFAVILPETDCKDVLKMAERIKQVIESKVFIFDSAVDKVTISIGLATTQLPMNTECLLRYADKALYKAKETKNTIVAYE